MLRGKTDNDMAKTKIFVLDTNIILHDHKAIRRFQDNDLVIPVAVVEELDKFKKGNDALAYHARAFMRELDRITDGKSFDVTIEDAFAGEIGKEDGKTFAKVDTVEEFLDAINKGIEKITLEGDIDLNTLLTAGTLSTRAGATLPFVIAEGKTLELDLNGFKISAPFEEGSTEKHYYAFENKGTFIVKDSKGNGQIIARGNFNYGTMTLESGSIVACDGNGGYGVRNYDGATFVMNGGSISTSLEDDHQVNNGGYDATTLRVENGAKATINGGTINNICDFTYAIDNAGEVVIKGGEIKSVHSTVSTYGTMTINGGSFTCNGLEGITAHALVAWDGSETTINGGTFDGKDNYNGFNVDACAGALVNIYGGKFLPVHSGSLYGEGTINVMGGEFFDDPSARVVEGYKAVEGNNVWTVVVDPAAKIGETEYNTLEEAFEAGGEITLLRNVTLAETVILAEGQTVVLNLDGKTITGPNVAKDAEGNRIHVIVNNGTLTINGNGTVQSIATNGGSAILNNGTLTLYNATIEGAPSDTATGNASYAVNTQGTNSGLIVNNTSISGRGAIGATNGTKVVLNGGTYHTPAVAWGHAVYANGEGTEVVVNGGTFSEGYEYKNDNWGMYQIYSGNKAKVIVKGGDFSQTWDCANGYDLCTASEGTIEIYGGTFADDPSKQNGKNFVAEGYESVKENDVWTVKKMTEEDKLRKVLAEGGEITLEEDITIAAKLEVKTTEAIVVNGNNKTINYKGSDRAFDVNGLDTANVTLNDLTFVNTESYCQRGINFNVDGKLTLNNVTVGETGTPATYAINLPGSSDGAEVVINNSYFCGNIALNVWGENAKIKATGSEFVSYDNAEHENYAAISLNNDGSSIANGTTIDIDGGKVIARDEKGEPSYAVRNSTMTGEVTISDSTEVVGTGINPVAAVIYEGYNEFYSCTTLKAAIDKAIETKGSVRLIKDIEVDETITISAEGNVTIDLNGKTISGTMHKNDGAVIKNLGTLTIKNGTISSTAFNGGSTINNQGTVTIEDATLNGANGGDGSWPSYPVNNYSVMTVTNTAINGYHGAVACNAAGETTVTNCTFTKNYFQTSSHVFYINHADAKVVVNGGTYSHNGFDGSLAYVNKGEITINDGTFTAKDGGYGIAALTGGKVIVNGGTLPAFLNWGGEIVDNRTK